ncbi:hypothetical protein V8G54_013132 [Vigna mungo]|uniref:Aminotransferase-like plant mobile domain-containing protein n=1 Tax=Vigna mungo TaxID=3915 RepID=A0AAQ3NSF2_VIGMU
MQSVNDRKREGRLVARVDHGGWGVAATPVDEQESRPVLTVAIGGQRRRQRPPVMAAVSPAAASRTNRRWRGCLPLACEPSLEREHNVEASRCSDGVCRRRQGCWQWQQGRVANGEGVSLSHAGWVWRAKLTLWLTVVPVEFPVAGDVKWRVTAEKEGDLGLWCLDGGGLTPRRFLGQQGESYGLGCQAQVLIPSLHVTDSRTLSLVLEKGKEEDDKDIRNNNRLSCRKREKQEVPKEKKEKRKTISETECREEKLNRLTFDFQSGMFTIVTSPFDYLTSKRLGIRFRALIAARKPIGQYLTKCGYLCVCRTSPQQWYQSPWFESGDWAQTSTSPHDQSTLTLPTLSSFVAFCGGATVGVAVCAAVRWLALRFCVLGLRERSLGEEDIQEQMSHIHLDLKWMSIFVDGCQTSVSGPNGYATSDDPIVEDRAFEEEAYQACEGPVEEEAFEASDDDYEEEEHVDVPDIQEEDVGGFPRGPLDASLLTHYVQHVVYAISQGQDRGDMLKLISHGEMMTTLDDVSTLLHLPVLGQLYDLEELEFEEAHIALVEMLGVDGGTTGTEMEDARGTKVRLYWLRDIYVQRCQSQHWDYAARAYLYAWGVATLAHLCEQLGDASLAPTKQMTRYLTLFQSWIYEYFPRMGRRWLMSSYDNTTPRATRWQSPRQGSTLVEILSQLDGLTYSGVVWHPYEGHRGVRPLFGFGFYQEIPQPPTVVVDANVVAVDFAWLHFTDHIIRNVRHASYPSECVNGYIQWFRRVSHPYIIATLADARPTLEPTQHPDVSQEARPHRIHLHHLAPWYARFKRMAKKIPSLISCRQVIEGTVTHQDTNDGIDEYSPTMRGQRHTEKEGVVVIPDVVEMGKTEQQHKLPVADLRNEGSVVMVNYRTSA